jgi:ABC-type phosphate transport system permease subunit
LVHPPRKKAFWRILPLVGLAHLFADMDHVNVSFAAAIATMSQIGAFVASFGWGGAKDAAGSFQPALITLPFVALAMEEVLLLLRHQLRGRAMHSVEATA